MDRYSLGISFGRHDARAAVYNIDRNVVEYKVSVPYSINTLKVNNLLLVVDQLFLALSKCAPLKQVAMIKVSGPEDLAVCSSDIFYKKLMKFSAYAESLESHFGDCFTLDEFLKPSINNSNYAQSYSSTALPEFRLPENALIFTLKNLISEKPEVWQRTTNIQFLSGFVTSLLAGKRSPVDSSCAKICGLQGNGNQWSETSTSWVSSDLKKKLDDIKDTHENFSYISSYFVEKYGLYREARILTAGGNSAACAQGAGGSVYLDTDDKLSLCAVVNTVPDSNKTFYLNGIVPGQSLCIVASDFDLLMSQSASFQIALDSIENIYLAPPLKRNLLSLKANLKINRSTLLFSQFAELKSNSNVFDKIFVTGALSEDAKFLQACADLFSSEIKVFDNSVYGAAIGNALNAARKIQETSFDEVLSAYFNSTKSIAFSPTPDGQSQMLSQLIAYSNR
jgi:sugar (pentulose or hexulose) kinase